MGRRRTPLSLVRINPGAETLLESALGGPWHFTAALTPFFDASGERLAHEKGEPIYFDWVQMPFIWLPVEEANPEGLSLWQIHLSTGQEEHTWSLSRTDEENDLEVAAIASMKEEQFTVI